MLSQIKIHLIFPLYRHRNKIQQLIQVYNPLEIDFYWSHATSGSSKKMLLDVYKDALSK